MQVTEILARLGGTTDSTTLIAASSRKRVRTALRRGDIVRAGSRGLALPTACDGLRAAQSLNGVMSGLSAAAYWRWELKQAPRRPHVTVPNKRKVEPSRRAGIDVHWRDIAQHDVYADIVTRPALTVITCARDYPFDEALAVADSALRHDDVIREELTILAERLPRGRDRCLRVATEADGRAANPFESVLRAIALGVPGLHVQPQVEIDDRDFWCRPDLVDVDRRIVIEAESFEFHSQRASLRKDCRRYTALTIRGWRVIRFCWEDVMFHPEYVRLSLLALVDPTALGPDQQALLGQHVARIA
jgi:very-short-patch-repair endonuclease